MQTQTPPQPPPEKFPSTPVSRGIKRKGTPPLRPVSKRLRVYPTGVEWVEEPVSESIPSVSESTGSEDWVTDTSSSEEYDTEKESTDEREDEEYENEESDAASNAEEWDEYDAGSSGHRRRVLLKTLIALLLLEVNSPYDWEDEEEAEEEEESDTGSSESDELENDTEDERIITRGHVHRIRTKSATSGETNNVRKFCDMTKCKSTHESVTFFKKLDPETQFEYLQKLEPFQKKLVNTKPLLLMVLDLPESEEGNKCVAIEKLNTINRLMHETNGSTEEISKINGWVHQFMRIPFGKYNTIPVSLQSTPVEQRQFLYEARQILDQVIYGMNDAKIQIIQLIGQILVNPVSANTSIGIEGPAGTGKTTLIKDGLSRIFNRPAKFIPLGGAVEGSMLEGSPSVYIGSKCGAIVNSLMTSQSMNPILIFDELDKLPDSSKGYEVTQVLMRLTDVTQNNSFSDKYFEEIEFDLSKCTCVFSYNCISKVDPTLASRLYKIKTDGYSYKDKIIIGKQYLLPKILKQLQFQPTDIHFEESAFRQILDRQNASEKGVRSFKHAIENICSKINIARLVNMPGNSDYNPLGEISFPFTVTSEIVNKLVPNMAHSTNCMMYI
jgi:hypothetical protein